MPNEEALYLALPDVPHSYNIITTCRRYVYICLGASVLVPLDVRLREEKLNVLTLVALEGAD